MNQTGLHYNYLAPASAVHFPEYQYQHVLTVSFTPTFKRQHFNPYDVGKFAGAAFLQPERFNGQTIELQAEPLTFDEVAAILSKVSGVEVQARFRSEEETAEIVSAKSLPVIESQLRIKEVDPVYDPKALEKWGIELETLEEYMVKEKGRLLETLGVKG